jgi:hypothetical protein
MRSVGFGLLAQSNLKNTVVDGAVRFMNSLPLVWLKFVIFCCWKLNPIFAAQRAYFLVNHAILCTNPN